MAHFPLLPLLLAPPSLLSLLALVSSSLGQNLPSEFFPSQSGLALPPSTAGADQNNTAKPSEEELISKLLKSGAGLPPGPPGSIGDGDGNANSGGTEEEGSAPAPPSIEPEQPPRPKNTPSQHARPAPSPPAQIGPFDDESHPPSAPPTYIQCLLQIAPKICDPDGVLSAEQKQEIDQTLTELLSATRKESARDECAKSGLETMFIIVRHSALLDDPMSAVQQKLNTAMDNWARDHPCEKPVVIMMSTDPSMYNRKVWSGRHFEVPVDPGQLVQLFMDQDSLIRQEKYAEVILNIIEGILDRYENAIGK